MPKFDIVVESPISKSVRAAQVSSMFDVPPQDTARLEWHGSLPIEERPWNVGLIVGPSGCGKSTILREVFGRTPTLKWNAASVIDDFAKTSSVEDIAGVCQAVGFNTIPAWLRPRAVLSNGEQFRVELARRLLEGGQRVVMDEFTSVVDRRVAQIGSHAVQKWTRNHDRQFVAATCHYDLEDWLQPDWILEPATMTFRWRAVQRRPSINCEIRHAQYEAWHLFARFHYLTAELHKAAQCYVLSVDGSPAALAAVLFRPHETAAHIYGMSRLVTLPDFQGLGLAFALCDTVASAYKACGARYRSYPAHPALIRSFDRSPMWALVLKPGMRGNNRKTGTTGNFGGRPSAIFEYCGPAMEDHRRARSLLGDTAREPVAA
jgi:ABC-type Mn2+/Zn2+ transport system ATPase subunit